MSHEDDAKRRIKEIYLRARRRIAELRKERRRIVDDFARKADAVRAAKVKKDIETL